MIKHINKIAIEVLRDRFADYDWHSNDYNEEYKMIVKALQLAKNNESLHLVSGCLPDESELAEAVDTAIYKSDCSTKPWIKEFKEQLKLSGYKIIESNNR